MNRSRYLHLLFICAIVLLAGAPAARVSAAQPLIVPFEITIVDEAVGTCDGFEIIQNAEITGTETTFFDGSGNPTRIDIHGRYTGTLTNSVTGTSLFDGPDPILAVINLKKETYALKGLHFRVTIPGQGIVILDAGTAVFYADGTVVAHGPAPDYEHLPQLLCSLLAEE